MPDLKRLNEKLVKESLFWVFKNNTLIISVYFNFFILKGYYLTINSLGII